ncbi:benzoate/H(+) symporter BenE family transporter [Paenisporosarcina antarctica]|uniref:Benzoate/H(+) symporter BenE family transporter n=1 Tax=Paenisporosarcina antarctica TaxID=417367 RepID=A0A4P6ZX48_9BACL|nr:benzoate/H(+) symporter BenE family transporter [Paenisporosarcina antarctica]QBP41011.1 benzoate/H(+) symporter BenE family transporter [Paenisporosarcina antarctica]
MLNKNVPFIKNALSIPKYLSIKNMSAGTVAAIICCTGPVLIVITAAQNGNLTTSQTISWLFGIYFVGGLLGIIMSLLFGQPIAGAYSIPSAVLMTQAITQYSFNEAVGAYLIAGSLIFIIGFLGWFDRLLIWLPSELVMAMIAGSMIHFGTDMIKSLSMLPLLGTITLLSYFIFAKIFPKIPPIIGAVIVGFTLFPFLAQSSSKMNFTFEMPAIWMPDFSLSAILAISIPITVMLLSTESAQGITVLKDEGYQPQAKKIIMISGIGTMFAGIFGGHSACMGGIMSALCASKDVGPKETRYVAAFISGVWLVIFGLLASLSLSFILLMPQSLIKLIAGLALIGVLLKSLQRSFHGKQFQLGAFFTLIIAMSGVNFLGISATFWALIGGWIVSWFLEKKDFKQRISSSTVISSKAA